MKSILYISFLLLLATSLVAQTKTGSILIKNGTVLTVTNGTKENTDVLIENGKITRIAKNIRTPRGVTEVDATGKFVMPGIIDAHSHLALDAVNEGTSPVTAEVFQGDALDPLDVGIYRALAGGVTSLHAMHGSANVIGGECETIKLRYGTYNPSDLVMEGAPRTIKFALGENPMRSHGEGGGIQPRTRMGVEQVIRRAFSEAQAYAKAKKAYEAKKSSDPTALPPQYDRQLETLEAILNGEIIIHCHSYRADEIYMLMNVCKDFGITKLVYQHTNEGFKVAPELAEFGAGASVFSDWWAYKFEVYYSTAYNATILTRNGVTTSINSDSGELIRHLYHEAAKTQRYGDLTDDEALALITINPAKQLGVGDRIGSLEVGKEGDVAIFNAHPLSVYAIPQQTIVDGLVYFDIENDANDQRLAPNPEETTPMFMEAEAGHHDDACMEGVFNLETLFKRK
ncbi:MAG: amidohydrolase family protein [Saprospiraceae bacterium]